LASEVIKIGTPAPPFELSSASGGRVRLADFQGKHNVVLFFMRAFT
jgi:peroxiredoxin